jgi:hypothetical protein
MYVIILNAFSICQSHKCRTSIKKRTGGHPVRS